MRFRAYRVAIGLCGAGRDHVGRLLLCAAVVLLGGCSNARPWINQPITGLSFAPAGTISRPVLRQDGSSPAIVAAVTLSGGGARAAAFGLGVLRELQDTRFMLGSRPTNLLDEVGLISGVSGGSVLAGYYAAFGDEVFSRFEQDFLFVDFQGSLIWQAIAPDTLYRLSSPWHGRSNVLAERLDKVFRGLTFGDLHALPRRPRLLITATDLTTGAPFEFTPEQFALICSDLNSVPLAFAVASSSAVPLLLSPITVRNYAGTCPQSRALQQELSPGGNLSARLLRMIQDSYMNAEERPYLHLVDGGLVDNLGVRSLLERVVANGSLGDSFRDLPPGSVHKIVLISVNSERDIADRIDSSDRVPSTFQVMDSLIFGAGSRATKETTAMVDETTRRLASELLSDRERPGSPFAADAEIHVISVSLQDVQDKPTRKLLLQVPTAFTILPGQVRVLQEAGRQALRSSPGFQRLRHSLRVDGAESMITPAAAGAG